ncbi:retrotransposon-related protein [Tanacetum coccineum]
MGQLSSKETELDGEAGFSDVAGSGIENFGLSHDESFGVDDLNLNLNEHVGLNVSQIETQSEEPDGIGQEDESAPRDEQFFNDVEGIYIAYETKYEGQSSEDAGKDDDDDEDDYFLEEAIHSYTEFFKELDKGNIENVKAPAIAVDYWRLPADATLLDVVMVVTFIMKVVSLKTPLLPSDITKEDGKDN